MTSAIDDTWLESETRWAEWNGEEFQCIDKSAAREMLAKIKHLQSDIRKVELALFPLSPELSGRPVELLLFAIAGNHAVEAESK